MRPRLALIFVLIVVTPLGVLGWLGFRASRNEEEAVRHKFQDVLHGKLKDIDDDISKVLQERERAFGTLTDGALFTALPAASATLEAETIDALRELVRKNALIGAIVILQPDGGLLHPPLVGDLTNSEREFLRRARRPILSRDLVQPGPGSSGAANSAGSRHEEAGGRPAQGWHTWYFDNGINLLFWRRMASGHVVGIELDRARLLADIIARLPNTVPDDATHGGGGIELLDSDGAAIYQWGAYRRGEKELPRAELAASPPLSSWHLKYYMPSADLDAALRGSRTFGFYGTFAALGLALLGLAFYFYREYSRDVTLAAQRVNFVNRVSHELKTPLTNIRLYAELLEHQFENSPAAGDQSAHALRRYLNVIVAESQRLSRLIGNVLLFGRQQKQAHVLHPAPGVVDDCLSSTLEQFRPAFEAKGIAVRHVRRAPAQVFFDADALGQILGNLFGNVEKYAASGGWMEVATNQKDGTTEVLVSDKGGGIPAAHRDKIFEPFYRISDSLSDGVAGTGIGLTIARELARLHGGDLTLDSSAAEQRGGATFRLVLRTLPARSAAVPPAGSPSPETLAESKA